MDNLFEAIKMGICEKSSSHLFHVVVVDVQVAELIFTTIKNQFEACERDSKNEQSKGGHGSGVERRAFVLLPRRRRLKPLQSNYITIPNYVGKFLKKSIL